MLNETGRNAAETNKTQSTHHSIVAEMLSEKILVPQSILQGEQDGALVQERRNQLEQGLVLRCLQRNQNQVARPDGVSGLVTLQSGNMKIFLFPTDADA